LYWDSEGAKTMPSTNLLPRDGDMFFFSNVIMPTQAAKLFTELQANIKFRHELALLYGRWQKLPRETAWFGDGAYQSSGVTHRPSPMPECLLPLKMLTESLADCRFNSVLLNRYRDGRDSVSWHSDDEPKLGPEPVIASLSLGATRRFLVRHRTDRNVKLALDLTAGSCLIMAGAMQQHWVHCVPKVRHAGLRINLTFRWVFEEVSPRRGVNNERGSGRRFLPLVVSVMGSEPTGLSNIARRGTPT
jgi:alkylated DNA repair dioxygenase AlkB